MKSIIALCLLGLISSTEAMNRERTLIRLNVNEYTQDDSDSSSDSSSDDETNVQVENPPCVYLDETKEELDY